MAEPFLPSSEGPLYCSVEKGPNAAVAYLRQPAAYDRGPAAALPRLRYYVVGLSGAHPDGGTGRTIGVRHRLMTGLVHGRWSPRSLPTRLRTASCVQADGGRRHDWQDGAPIAQKEGGTRVGARSRMTRCGVACFDADVGFRMLNTRYCTQPRSRITGAEHGWPLPS